MPIGLFLFICDNFEVFLQDITMIIHSVYLPAPFSIIHGRLKRYKQDHVGSPTEQAQICAEGCEGVHDCI